MGAFRTNARSDTTKVSHPLMFPSAFTHLFEKSDSDIRDSAAGASPDGGQTTSSFIDSPDSSQLGVPHRGEQLKEPVVLPQPETTSGFSNAAHIATYLP